MCLSWPGLAVEKEPLLLIDQRHVFTVFTLFHKTLT